MRRTLTWTLAAATCSLFYLLWWMLCREPKFILADYPLVGGTCWNHAGVASRPDWLSCIDGNECTRAEWEGW